MPSLCRCRINLWIEIYIWTKVLTKPIIEFFDFDLSPLANIIILLTFSGLFSITLLQLLNSFLLFYVLKHRSKLCCYILVFLTTSSIVQGVLANNYRTALCSLRSIPNINKLRIDRIVDRYSYKGVG